MKLTPLAQQMQHFDRSRELQDVEKRPLTNPDDIAQWAQESFQRTRQEDDGPKDLNPLPGRVFLSDHKTGKTSGATFDDHTLERTDIHNRERRCLRLHQTPVAIEAFWSWSHPDYPQLIECFRIDQQDPKNSFYQRLELPPCIL